MNYCGLIFAAPGFGKTSIAIEIADTFLAKGVKVFAHDPNKMFRGRAAEYASVAEYDARVIAAEKKEERIPACSSFNCPAAEVRDLVVRLGRKHNDMDRVKVPMLMIFDEGSLVDSGSTYISKEDQALLANRRHLGVGVLFLLQRTAMLTKAFRDFATDLYVMNQPVEDLEPVEKSLRLPAGSLRDIAALSKHRYVHAQIEHGVVKERI